MVEQTLVPLLKGVGWATVQWGLLALFFAPLFVWITRSARSRQAALTWVIVVGLIFLAAVGVIDFWRSFGEALAGSVNRYRTTTWFSLTVIAIVVAAIGASRARRSRG